MIAPHLTPALSAPRGGEGEKGRAEGPERATARPPLREHE